MTKEHIVNEVANSSEYIQICRRICPDNSLYRDLFQELIIILHDYEGEKLIDLYQRKCLKFFIIRILQSQCSPTGPFYRKSIDFNRRSNELIGIELMEDSECESKMNYVDCLLQRSSHANKSEWYEENVFKSYINAGGLRKLERKTGIQKYSLSKTIKSYQEKAIKQIESVSKLDQIIFISESERERLKSEVLINGLDVDSVITMLNIKNRLCLKKAVSERL